MTGRSDDRPRPSPSGLLLILGWLLLVVAGGLAERCLPGASEPVLPRLGQIRVPPRIVRLEGHGVGSDRRCAACRERGKCPLPDGPAGPGKRP